ncbi:hypothetical protein HNQ51_000405 [Inhella inkyongensis]|uniref:Uncharacterized protein n=1 Tax=Inhella inkyongensis TaxID=392593 RepID=A0A840S0S2_9BURK|nr:hypothetical protein [Inhella inkyongensis]MBB5203112.1 hypothetical protein [Inhella inkyongensis]
MTITLPPDTRPWLKRHWFLPLAAAIVLGDLASVFFGGWGEPQWLEAALLIDFALVLPLLYAWCYRTQGKVARIKAAGLSCLAHWATGKLVPAEHQYLLREVAWLRNLGLAALLLLEIKLGVMVYRAVLQGRKTPEAARQQLEQEGMPAWAAKIMAWEANLWVRAWRWLRRDRS